MWTPRKEIQVCSQKSMAFTESTFQETLNHNICVDNCTVF